MSDMQEMVGEASLRGPVQNFLTLDPTPDVPLDQRLRSEAGASDQARPRLDTERLISLADPCQARAVRLARECNGLVVHGPPGTGKSHHRFKIGISPARCEFVYFLLSLLAVIGP